MSHDAAWDHACDLFFAEIAGVRALSGHTVEAYARDLHRLAAFLSGETSPQAATPEHLLRFAASLAPVLGKRSQARALSAVRQFFRFLHRRGLRADHPAKDLKPPRAPRPLPTVPSEAEMRRLLDGLSGDDAKALRDRAMFELLYGSGLRVSELCGLRRDGLFFDRGLVRVCGKGDKERLVPMGLPAQAALRRHLEHGPEKGPGKLRRKGTGEPLGEKGPGRLSLSRSVSAYVFPGRGGRAISRVAVFKILKRRALAAGFQTLPSPHELRHAFATHLVQNGADLRVVQTLLGHAHIQTTEVYTHLDARRLRAIYDQGHPRAATRNPHRR
ncbi:MAG: tyrosine recombinase [Deltaproteobacteria bacterium]|nr:tyrosine recombinase [Deltaproteobacteria bacterium]